MKYMWVMSELIFFFIMFYFFGFLNFGLFYKYLSLGNWGVWVGKFSMKCIIVLLCNVIEMYKMCRYLIDFLRMLFILVYVYCVVVDIKIDIGFGFDWIFGLNGRK